MNRRVAVGSCALAFAAGWNIANVGPVADPLAREYGVGLAAIGLLTTALLLGHLVSQLPGGHAIDRWGARRVGIAALAWTAAANAALLAAPDPGLGLTLRALAGLGTGAGFLAAADYARSARSPLVLGLFGGASVGGSGLAVAFVPLLDGMLGWRAPYWTALALAVAALPLLLLGPRDVLSQRPERTDSRLLGDRRLYRLGVVHGATFGLSVVAGNWIVALLSRTSDYPDERAGLAGSLILVGSLATRPLGGVVLRRRPDLARRLVAGSLAAGAAGTAVLAAVAPVPLALAAAAALTAGLAAGLPFSPVFAAVQRLRPDAPGAALGLVNGIAVLAIVGGTPLAGLSFSLPGDGRIGFAALATLWAGALLALPSRRELSPP